MIITTAVTPGPPYEDELQFWENGLTKLGYSYIIGRLENTGDWMTNCLLKPAYILDVYNRFPNDGVLWLDVDTRVQKKIDLIYDNINKYDFFCFEDKNYKLHHRGWWLNAGVLYFAPSTKGRSLLETWVSLCSDADPASFMPEQNCLADAYYQIHPNFYPLPLSYNCDWDNPAAKDATIIQEKVSRKYKNIINSGKNISGIKGPITVMEARMLNKED